MSCACSAYAYCTGLLSREGEYFSSVVHDNHDLAVSGEADTRGAHNPPKKLKTKKKGRDYLDLLKRAGHVGCDGQDLRD